MKQLGKWQKTIGHPPEYFESRGILLDCRGPLVIDKGSHWGLGISVFTESHRIDGPHGNPASVVIPYGVTVEAGAWICSGAILAGCHIDVGAIVAAGTVVRGQYVAPMVIVAGNPARVVARLVDGQWMRLPPEESGYRLRLL